MGVAVHAEQVACYLSQVAGPLLDRIDLLVEVPRVPPTDLTATSMAESSSEIRARVLHTRAYDRADSPIRALLAMVFVACRR